MKDTELIRRTEKQITKAIIDAAKANDREAAKSWSGAQIEFNMDPRKFCGLAS